MADERLIAPGILDESNRALNGLAERVSNIDPSVVAVYDVDNVDPSALPALLEQFRVDFIKPDQTEAQQRELIKTSIARKKVKGTPGAVVDMLTTLLGVEPDYRDKPLFVAGWSRVGVDPIHNPPNQFRVDDVIDSDAAQTAGIKRAEAERIVEKMKRGVVYHTVRFQPAIVGSWDYGLVGIDLTGSSK